MNTTKYEMVCAKHPEGKMLDGLDGTPKCLFCFVETLTPRERVGLCNPGDDSDDT